MPRWNAVLYPSRKPVVELVLCMLHTCSCLLHGNYSVGVLIPVDTHTVKQGYLSQKPVTKLQLSTNSHTVLGLPPSCDATAYDHVCDD